MNKDESWHVGNLLLIAKALPLAELRYDPHLFNWLMLDPFPLPENIRPANSRLLILTGGSNKPITYRPEMIYVDTGLTNSNGQPLGGLYERVLDPLHEQGFVRLSITLHDWNPSYDVMAGDNLITVINHIHQTLKEQ